MGKGIAMLRQQTHIASQTWTLPPPTMCKPRSATFGIPGSLEFRYTSQAMKFGWVTTIFIDASSIEGASYKGKGINSAAGTAIKAT
jgi:hypothetical protein